MTAVQPLRASCVALRLLLGVESSREAGVIPRGRQGGELQRSKDSTFNMLLLGGQLLHPRLRRRRQRRWLLLRLLVLRFLGPRLRSAQLRLGCEFGNHRRADARRSKRRYRGVVRVGVWLFFDKGGLVLGDGGSRMSAFGPA